MTIKSFLKKIWVEEAVPKPISQIIKSYGYQGDSPEVSFERKIYYHSISPQIQVGVTGYARLLDPANIIVNTDDEQSKKIIEDWIEDTDFKTKFEAMCNTFLICGNSILEKLDDKLIQDVAEVDMKTIVGKKRDDAGNTLYYIQQAGPEQRKLGETKLDKFIEFNLSTISRGMWSPCIFESACIPRMVGNRNTLPLVELVVGLEDAMSTIVLNNAYPEVYYTFEGANEEELKREAEKLRKKKPGDRSIVTKQPKIDLFEAKGQSAYVDYIKYLYNSLSASVKFPIDIINGDFTSRASSETSADLPQMVASSIKRYLGNKLKQELFDLILQQNGKDPKKANLQITFGSNEVTPLTPADVVSRFEKKLWTVEEAREWDKDNTNSDLFDDDVINNEAQAEKEQQVKDDMIPVDDKKGGFVMKPRIVTNIKKEKIKEGFGATVIYKLDYGHDKTDVCDDYADNVYEIDSPDIPKLPDETHPNCKCYFEDEESGEYLGQDPISAINGTTIEPESFRNIKKEFAKRDEQIKLLQEKLAERELQESSEKAKTTKEILGLLRDLK